MATRKAGSQKATAGLTLEQRPVSELTANPDNYRHHPPGQIEQIKHSLQTLGQYKNVVITPEGVILAGHGVVQAAAELDWQTIAVHVFDGTEEQQRKLMVADNELSRMAEDDDAQLSQLLSAIRAETGLEGTGFDDEGLAALLAEVDTAVPPFMPVSADEQGRLDQLEPKWVQCPQCGDTFDARQAEA